MGKLDGLRVVVTRAAHQAEDLASLLEERGAEVLLFPVIAIAPPADPRALELAAKQADQYDWIVFTSANAIHAFIGACKPGRSGIRAQIATVGSATRAIAERSGLQVSLTPERYVAEALIESFGGEDLAGRRILIPSAAVTRDVVAPALRARGAIVEVIEAYRNVIPDGAAARAAEIFREPFPDWLTVASSSAVENLVRLAGVHHLARVKIASIGPVTSSAVRVHGLDVAAEAVPHTVLALAESIAK
ncbi:MAG TPA: uroporphyrinogen-III synthase [Bryobacteraceae bacterium]